LNSLISINKYFYRYRGQLLLGFLFVTLNSVLLTFPGIYIGKATELFRAGSKDESAYLNCALMIIAFSLSGAFFMFLMRQTLIVMSRFIEFDQKNEIYSHYQQLDQDFYKRNFTGDLMNRISEDVSRVRMYTGPAIMYLANTLATVVTSIIFMVNVDGRMALAVLAPLPVLSFIIYKVSAKINQKSSQVQEQLSEITSITQEAFSGVRTIKSYSKENYFTEKLNLASGEYRKRALSLVGTEALFQPFMVFMVGLSLLLSIYVGGWLVAKGDIRAGDISAYVFYIFRLTWPFASLGWVTSLIQRASASQQRINEFLMIKPTIKNSTATTISITGQIEFRDVSYIYPETGRHALHNISFRLESGSSLGIIGPTGSGKSTIGSLLARMYDVNAGKILVDDVDVREHELGNLRKSMGYVPQDVFLFSETVKNNIAFGAHVNISEDLRNEKIINCAKTAMIHDNILLLPKQYETIVGERGVTLSGGQKQRISIARALLKEPKILIFDDCLSAVDTETEDRILSNLKNEMKKSTTIFISHRVSGVRNCDYIIFLKEGKIVEEGSHAQLMEKNGEYAGLYRLQTIEHDRQN
jgi:ATP-binding cassette, subfamily B, multidrug efflux pump